MTVYFIAYLLMIIVYFLCNMFIQEANRKKWFCLISFFIWSTVLCFRHPSMGVDLQYGKPNGYLGMYSQIADESWSSIFESTFLNYEKGYVIFNKLLGYISKDGQFLLIACGIICVASMSWLIYKYSPSCLLSFVIFLGLPCFLLNFSGLRQAVAISITVFSFSFIRKKKLIPFVLLVLLASCFHKSAIIFLVAYPCYYINSQKTIIKIISVALLPAVYIFRYQLFSLLAKILKPNAVPDNNSAITLFIIFSLIYVFCLLFEHKSNKNEIGCRNLFYIACLCQAFGGVYSTSMRIGYYFMIYIALALAEVVTNNAQNSPNVALPRRFQRDTNAFVFNENSIVYAIIFVCFLFFGLYSLADSSWAMTNPYSFFWN